MPVESARRMKCPTCPDVTLLISHRDDVEIDYCPQCRGVWLDRGELDKLIRRERDRDDDWDDDRRRSVRDRDYDRDRRDDRDRDYDYGKKRKRKSMLSEIFDF